MNYNNLNILNIFKHLPASLRLHIADITMANWTALKIASLIISSIDRTAGLQTNRNYM